MRTARLDSPIGPLDLTTDGDVLVSIEFDGASASAATGGVAARLVAYFDGDLAALDDIDVRFDRGTSFQRDVWFALREIPVGRTISYAELALRVGRPTAFRAVGAANGQNPVPVVVPCHRVIAAGGGLGGYAGGLDVKQWLLDHECAVGVAERTLPGLG